MPCAPTCTLCHADAKGGVGTIKPASFGESLMTVGALRGDDEAGVRCAVARVACELLPDCPVPPADCFPTDSDNDGTPDAAELRQGADPNDARSDASFCGPTYGCKIGRATRGDGGEPFAVLAALGAVLGLGWVRRRGARRLLRA